MAGPTDKERYAIFLASGPLKRVYVDIPLEAHTMLKQLALDKGLPVKAQLTLLIADAVEKPKRAVTRPTRSKKIGNKKASRKIARRKKAR